MLVLGFFSIIFVFLGSPDTSGGFSSDTDGELLSSIEAALASSPVSLSDGSEQFNLEIEERNYSLLQSDSDERRTANMSANREDVAETPAAKPRSPTSVGVSLSRHQEVFTPVYKNIRQFDIGKLLKKLPLPPPLRVPIYGSVPSAGSPTLDGLHPIYYGEDSRVGPYAFYGRFISFSTSCFYFSLLLYIFIFRNCAILSGFSVWGSTLYTWMYQVLLGTDKG